MIDQKLSESSSLLSEDKMRRKHENPHENPLESPGPTEFPGSSEVEKPGMDYKFFYTGLLGKLITTFSTF